MSTQKGEKKPVRPPQQQKDQPGHVGPMRPKPVTEVEDYQGCGKLVGRVALVTGGDSGIGRAAAVRFAQEGADVAIVYLDEHEDARSTKERVEKEGRRCIMIAGDVGDEAFCREVVERTVKELGSLDILVNNAGEQHEQESILDISREQLEKTFRTNIFSMFYFAKAALPHMKWGSSIINTTSITAYRGSDHLIDYASTKGAIVAFTRSLATSLLDKGIRVNAVAPGPIWTPLIPATFSAEHVANFGADAPMKRVGQPVELAAAYLFLASKENSYMTGQVLHPNGGEIVNG